MDQSWIPLVAAGGALVVSAGSFAYLSSKLDEISTKLEAVTKNSLIQLGKLSQHDDEIKVSNSKIKDIEILSKELNALNIFVKDLSNSIKDDFEKVDDYFSRQDKKIKSLSSKVDIICKSLNIKFEQEVEKEKHVDRRKKKIKKITPDIIIKESQKEEKLEPNEVNILNEMENILNL